MSNHVKWKKLISDQETVSYIKETGEYKVIIEARQNEDGWDIIKKYLGSGVNFAETYSAQSPSELRKLLKSLRTEKDLSKNEIKDITKFKQKNLKVLVKRGWKTQGAEKWHFSISDDYANYITIQYGNEVHVDIVMEERLKYIEEKLIAKLYEVLGLEDVQEALNQHIYYFTKKTSSYYESANSEIDFEFLFE